MVMGKRPIAARYLTSWFPLDVLSVFPFDAIISRFSMADSNEVGVVTLLKSARLVKAAKVLRLLKVVKLLRLMRLPRLFSRLEQLLSRSLLNLIMLLGAALLLCNVVACSFYYVSAHFLVCPSEHLMPLHQMNNVRSIWLYDAAV